MTSTEKDKRRAYSMTEIILGNAALIGWILLGAAACWLFNFFAALGFTALAGFLVYYKLGKKGCLSCYLCKTCTIGMGKLPDLFFAKNGTSNVNRKALTIFPFVYLLLSAVPVVLVSVSIGQELSAYKLVLLALLLLFSVYTGLVRRKNLFG
jgi:hypothetical protein